MPAGGSKQQPPARARGRPRRHRGAERRPHRAPPGRRCHRRAVTPPRARQARRTRPRRADGARHGWGAAGHRTSSCPRAGAARNTGSGSTSCSAHRPAATGSDDLTPISTPTPSRARRAQPAGPSGPAYLQVFPESGTNPDPLSRHLDASALRQGRKKTARCRDFVEPTRGLEPRTPSLPWRPWDLPLRRGNPPLPSRRARIGAVEAAQSMPLDPGGFRRFRPQIAVVGPRAQLPSPGSGRRADAHTWRARRTSRGGVVSARSRAAPRMGRK